MRIGLITPEGTDINPGSRMITAGIRYLLRRAVPDAVFVPIQMLERDVSWKRRRRVMSSSCAAIRAFQCTNRPSGNATSGKTCARPKCPA